VEENLPETLFDVPNSSAGLGLNQTVEKWTNEALASYQQGNGMAPNESAVSELAAWRDSCAVQHEA
jgi:hypothetical protein